jgi:aminoglycoside phosphotransferase (APT) family kinase protein
VPVGKLLGMVPAVGVRIGWADLPEPVQAGVEAVLAAPVVSAISQPGGFSPGTADRVRTAAGDRAFVKAVSPALNAHTPALHRQEARVTAALPPDVPVPRLLGVYDDGEWVALVLEDVAGRHPRTPWLPAELTAVLAALETLAERLTPTPVPDVPATATMLAAELHGWRRVADDPPADLDPWARSHLDQLGELAGRGLQALGGATLVHTDIRADNLLVRADGSVVVVDWPWASRGPAWLDILLVLVNVCVCGGGGDVDALLAAHTSAEVDPSDLTAVLAGLAGYYVDVARQPAPAGLPTVRAFQQQHARAVLAWVRRRLTAR